MLKRFILAALMFAAVPTAVAAEAPLTPDTAVAAALQHNPAVIEAGKRWEEKANRVTAARALPNPVFGVMKDDVPTSSINPLDGMMTEYTLSQEFMNPGKLNAMEKMAVSEAAMGAAEYEAKKLDIATQVRLAYYDYLYNTRAARIMQENQQLMRQLVDLAQVNYATGMTSLQDALKAQTEVARMDAELAGMEAMTAAAAGRLNTLLGRPADAPLQLAEVFAAAAPDQLAGLSNYAPAAPGIRGMEQQVEMAKSGVELAKRQSNPDFEVSLGYKTYKAMTSSGQDSMGMPVTTRSRQPSTWNVGVMVMIPLWDDKNKADVRAATASLEASQAALQTMRNMQAMDFQMALADARAFWRQIELYQKVVIPQSEAAYQAAIAGYGSGKVDMMDMLEGAATLRDVQLALYKARVEYEKAAALLAKAAGSESEKASKE
ncbi:MAG: TolC family protein [Sporomusaceae bacterium]|nr:TolC family protein [Sporomusaceae bacterium]